MQTRLEAAYIVILAVFPVAAGAQDAGAPAKTADSNGFLSRVWLSGQINIVTQWHPPFRSPYSGPNSFQAYSEIQASRVLTLYTGLKLANGTDILFDLENTNGRDLGQGKGLAGFTNLDLAGVPNSHPYVARALLHHVFSMSSDAIDVDRGPLQLASQVPARRLELYAGKLSLLDFFDVNVIGSDSHFQFLNWTVDNNAPYGYPADTRGYTYAVLTEDHDRSWVLRFAEALTPKLNNPDQLDVNLARSRSENVEMEVHHQLLPGRNGAIRLLGFVDHGILGDYRKAIHAFEAGLDSSPDITLHRDPGQIKYGFGANLEQEINSALRAFGRFGWAEGHKESLAFTEANQSVSGGFDLRGKLWKRPDDKIGAALVLNGLSGDHREYLALGGLGVLLGDGKLNYGRERIVEAYYTFKLWRGIYAAADLQRIWSPGYNRDRGPVLVPALRLHLEGALFTNPR